MNEFTVYEMQYAGKANEIDDINMIPFDEKYWLQYKQIYNECFYEMREALDVKPYDFYSDIEQIKDKTENIFLFINDNIIIGSVGCYGNEIDDLIVNKKYQHNGYGRKLLLWAINYIRTYSNNPITLHVADWNKNALKLYKDNGFVIIETLKIDRESENE